MKIENPAALHFIMQDEIYLLPNDKAFYQAGEVPVVADISEPTAQTPPLSFNYLGKHKKNFLILVHYQEPEFIADAHLTALQSIIGRLQYTMDDIAIFNLANHAGADFGAVADFFKPQKLLVLGKNALPNGINSLTLNVPQKLDNCNALYSFSFDEMMDRPENKKAFWEQMKLL